MTVYSFFTRVAYAWRYVAGKETVPPKTKSMHSDHSNLLKDKDGSTELDVFHSCASYTAVCNTLSYEMVTRESSQTMSTHRKTSSDSSFDYEVKSPGLDVVAHESVIHEVYGNTYQGTLQPQAKYRQVFSEMPSNIPVGAPLPAIDLQGRPARHVIGRVIGNVNSADIPAGATFEQEFMPIRSSTITVPPLAPSLSSSPEDECPLDENSGYGFSMVKRSTPRSASMPADWLGRTLGQRPANKYPTRC